MSPAGLEKTPMVRGEDGGGKVVYNYDPKNSFVSFTNDNQSNMHRGFALTFHAK